MQKRGTIDLDNETMTAERLLNARGSFRQTSVLSRADSAMKPNISSTQTVRFRLPLGASCQPSAQIATEVMPDPLSLTAGRRYNRRQAVPNNHRYA